MREPLAQQLGLSEQPADQWSRQYHLNRTKWLPHAQIDLNNAFSSDGSKTIISEWLEQNDVTSVFGSFLLIVIRHVCVCVFERLCLRKYACAYVGMCLSIWRVCVVLPMWTSFSSHFLCFHNLGRSAEHERQAAVRQFESQVPWTTPGLLLSNNDFKCIKPYG